MKKFKNNKKHEKTVTAGKLYRSFIELMLTGCVTGVFAGVIVTLFNILAHEGESISRDVYAYLRANPLFIPLLLLGLFAVAVALGWRCIFLPLSVAVAYPKLRAQRAVRCILNGIVI